MYILVSHYLRVKKHSKQTSVFILLYLCARTKGAVHPLGHCSYVVIPVCQDGRGDGPPWPGVWHRPPHRDPDVAGRVQWGTDDAAEGVSRPHRPASLLPRELPFQWGHSSTEVTLSCLHFSRRYKTRWVTFGKTQNIYGRNIMGCSLTLL